MICRFHSVELCVTKHDASISEVHATGERLIELLNHPSLGHDKNHFLLRERIS